MKIPQLPTDNLYKFLALYGLAIWLVSFFYPKIRSHEIELMLNETDGEARLLQLEIESLAHGVVSYDRRWGFAGLSPDSVRARMYAMEPDELDDAAAEARARQGLAEEQIRAAERLQIRASRIDILERQLRRWESLSRLGSLFGSLLISIGFTSWYFMLQRPQDKLLQRQAKAVSADESDKSS